MSGACIECGRPVSDQRQYCLFHTSDKTASEINHFDELLMEDAKRQLKEDQRNLSFAGFHFPKLFFPSRALPMEEPGTVDYSIDFSNCIFEEGIFCDDMTFRSFLIFNHAIFKNIVEFNRSEFAGNVWFVSAVFPDHCVFAHSDFGGLTIFSLATFRGAVFEDVAFEGGAWFHDTKFEGMTSFDQTVFKERSLIKPIPSEKEFGLVSVTRSRFTQSIELDWSAFLQNPMLTLLRLGECVCDSNSRLTLRGDMRYISLLSSDLSRAEFIDESWQAIDESLEPVQTRGRRRVLEEHLLERLEKSCSVFPDSFLGKFRGNQRELVEDDFDNVTSDRVVQLYRRLRENYERNKRYSEAGDFFVGEMEILRKYKTMQTAILPKAEKRTRIGEDTSVQRQTTSTDSIDTPRVEKRPLTDPYRLLLELYRALAMYGESIKRPAIASFLSIVFFALARLLQIPSLSWGELLNALVMTVKESVFAFFQLGGASDIDRMERLMSPVILGVLFVALRRRLERQ